MEEKEINQGRMKENQIYLSLGSNLGDRIHYLLKAIELIGQRLGRPLKVSKIYQSGPWGFQSDNVFYNCCLSASCSLDPLPLMEEILKIENEMGRVRSGERYGDRIIDIDLLFIGEVILDCPGLVVPHPSLGSRRFVLEPLLEIAPLLVHPVNGLTVRELLEQCPDQGVVTPVTEEDHL